ncbi:15942_t:CDS:2 [Cetraspora pellucida]|uniref:15942_t:CDS:1 n=1 Tax=Cetraspora pellucida TaxID=1433469 RepID=A0ACA9M9W1_9GLOM|nr:15942_t:CDS:2 [Cetraspora pellucida]
MAIQQGIIKFVTTTDYFHLFIFFTIIYVLNFYYKYFTRPNPLPGPLPLPIIGNYHNLGSDVRQFYIQCQSKYGGISEAMLGHRYIVLSRPDYVDKVLDRKVFHAKLPYSQGLDEMGMYGHGIVFNDDYESWRSNSKFFTDAFLPQRYMDNVVKSTIKLYEELSGYWQSLGNQNTSNYSNDNWTLETDLAKWFHRYTNDIISIVITGERTYSIASYYNTQSRIKSEYSDALVEDGDKFVKSIIEYIECITFFSFFGPFIRHYIPMVKDKNESYLKNRDYLVDMLTSLINANTNAKDSNDEALKSIADEEIRGNILDAFLGGTDTQKMLSEIDLILPKTSDISHNDLQKLKYCEAIIKEAYRMVPVAPFAFRTITEDCEIAGYKWTRGTNFLINYLAIHGHPEFWPDPEVFNPDRFYNKDQYDKSLGDKLAFMMFGGGRRICPGRKLAMIELLLSMVLVFKNYNVELVNMKEPLKILTLATTNCQELNVRISPRA